jgi:hypothetical protein
MDAGPKLASLSAACINFFFRVASVLPIWANGSSKKIYFCWPRLLSLRA